MSTYDPRRSRPTPKAVPDEESAPIDVLLGPEEGVTHPAPQDAAAEPAAPPAAVPVRRVERAPSALLQLAPALVVALALLVVWLIRRSRR